MRTLILALLLAPAALAAQEVGPGTEVDRISLKPGESVSFTLAKGFDHQLLRRSSAEAKGAITVRYEVAGGQSTITATSRVGHKLDFSILADPDGNGGFQSMGAMQLPGDGAPVSRSWPGSLGTINVGGFEGGPHGDHAHQPTG